jgi:hypothetical protein
VSDVLLLLEVLAFCKEPWLFVGMACTKNAQASEPLARAAFGIEPDEPFQLLSLHDF